MITSAERKLRCGMDKINGVRATAWLILPAVMILSLVLALPSGLTAKARSPSIHGTYLFVRESSGYGPARDAEVIIKFSGPNLVTVTATRPGKRTVLETGRFSVQGDRITLQIPGLGRSCRGKRFRLKGDRLTLPILIIDSGTGTSTWRRLDAKPDPLTRAAATFRLKIRAGESPARALAAVAAGLRQDPAIKAVAVAGRTLLVTYRSGRREFFLFVSPGRNSGGSNRSSRPTPGAAGGREQDEKLGMIPAQFLIAPPRRPVAPLAEKFQKMLALEPQPCSSGDAPTCRRALVLAPFDTQPIQVLDGQQDTYETFRQGGHDLAVVVGPLRRRAKYEVTLKRDQQVSVAEMYRQLTGCWGLVFFDTHGGVIGPNNFLLATGTMIPASRSGTRAARDKFLNQQLQGLPAKVAKTVMAGVVNGHWFLAVTSGFFKAAGGDLSRALVFVNGCESTETPALRRAIGSRVFMGWATAVDIHLGGDVLAPFFDALSRKTRSGREAWDYAVRYLLRVKHYDKKRAAFGNSHDPKNLVLYRKGATQPAARLTYIQWKMAAAVRTYALRQQGRPQGVNWPGLFLQLLACRDKDIGGGMPRRGSAHAFCTMAFVLKVAPPAKIIDLMGEICGGPANRFTLRE
jgi:hypothetical protein